MPANRPTTFAAFHGQPDAIEQLRVPVAAARRTGRVLGHVLLVGPPGLGKTTLGRHVLANELGLEPRQVQALVCSAIEKPEELLRTLTTVPAGGLLFLDEVHALAKPLQEHLYSLLEDSRVTIRIDDQTVIPMTVDPYTVVGATTREGMLTAPMRSRFKHTVRLDLYDDRAMAEVLEWQANAAGTTVTPAASTVLAPVCHGTARHAANFIDACLDTLHAAGAPSPLVIDQKIAQATLKRLRYTKNGLSRAEVELLRRLKDAPNHTAGLTALSAYLDEEADTIEAAYEPWLLRTGLIERTPQGRRLTVRGEAALADA